MGQCGGRISQEGNVNFIVIDVVINIAFDIVIGSVLVVVNYLVEAGAGGQPGQQGGISGHVIRPRKAASSLPQRPSHCSSATLLLVFSVVIAVIVIVISVSLVT